MTGPRGEIVAAAAKTFARMGYSGARIDDVAAEMGATKGRVYHYYTSKAEILADILTEAAYMLTDAVQPVLDEPGIDSARRLERMAVRHTLVLLEQNDVQVVTLHNINLMIGRAVTSDTSSFRRIAEVRRSYEQIWRTAIEVGVEEGALHAVDIDLATKAVLGALNWSTVWYRPDPTDSDSSRLKIAEILAHHAIGGVLRR
ncbi:TetR/AcrR family transcriptional regulator [Rhodococcus sp. T2V]|uniref:TetR/AcrR family transcriptional regulator n=1 Tax=Rhodococcus sp. T2V TaxID=3034164 RepID=UPI0023E0E057|nr:TetR/AcrR family transcriptional regulator [Rhodococcus sp. T2V]MDF3311894.1 TetR/AcrR family transcriptional regulator [Rhodococcus sp. T2V]